jgi:hypothetical protein
MLLIEGTIAGPSREPLGQCSNQAQEFLLLWSVPSRDQKDSDLNVGNLATRGKIRLMPDEHSTCFRIADEQPPIPVGTAVNLSHPNGHANFAPYSTLFKLGSARLNGRGCLGDAPRGRRAHVSARRKQHELIGASAGSAATQLPRRRAA